MIPRGKLYISYKEVLWGMIYCIADLLKLKKPSANSKEHNELICLSVRTGFDLVLRALNLSPGSEVLVTDINIPDMFKIIAAHNLIALPLAVNKHTLNLSAAQIEAAITPATKAILITHLFGSRMDTDEIIAIAQKHNLSVFEDCAQAYAGDIYEGNKESDVVMFSFGLIKTNTAINGALIRLKSRDLFQKVAAYHHEYPVKSTTNYLKKLFRVAIIKLLITRYIYTLFYRLVVIAKKDFDDVLSNFTKGFQGEDILKLIRYQPSVPNVKLLQKKLRRFNSNQITLRVTLAGNILRGIPDRYKIGSLNLKHTHWVIPVETNNPNALIKYLRKHGFDATQKASSLIKLNPRVLFPGSEALVLDNLVYLPADVSMSETEQKKLTELLFRFQA